MSRRAPRSRNILRASRLLTCFLAASALVIGTVAPATAAQASIASTVSSPASASSAVADPASTDIAKSTLVGFNAGNIISDAVFTNKDTMTEAQIQSFFNSKVSSCQSGYVCLKDFKITSVTRPADAYCKGYTGAANESAARIIYRVAQACNINPQVLIVMLQKEQGLITHTWPSAWRYNIALGQGCPDTAPCDPNYIGFFHQIYGAARQMQIYMEGKWFQWYAPGKTWNILYNPNSACGTSRVYVANKATAALYYYTPYQPNAAALGAGYGLGDGCSAYGNRNFYNYFTDWFGSTQQAKVPDGPIVNVGDAIYAITNGTAYHILPEVWPQYRAAFGDPEPTTSAHIASLAQGGRATLFVHNEKTGTVAYLDGGKTHRFSSCALVASWGGGNCSALTRFDDEDYRTPAAGDAMTARVNVAGDGRRFVIEGTDLVPYYSLDAALAWGQKTGGYAATMPKSTAANYRALPTRFVPGQFLTIAGSSRAYLPSLDGELHYVPSTSRAVSMGLPWVVTKNVPASALAQYKTTTNLGRFLSCNNGTYFTAGGGLYRVTSSGGFSVAAFDTRTCGMLDVADETAAPLFVRVAGDSAVYTASEGVMRHVVNPTSLTALNGTGTARVISLSSTEMADFPKGPPIRTDIGFVTTPGDGRVYLADAGRLIYVSSWAVADALGLPRGAVTISDAVAAGMPKSGSLTTLVRCNGQLYSGAGGVLTNVAEGGTVPVTDLSAGNCATLPLPR